MKNRCISPLILAVAVLTGAAAAERSETTAVNSQRVVKEVWKLSPDLLDDSPVHIDALAVLVSYAREARLQLGLSMSVLRVVRVGQYQLCQRQVIGSCLHTTYNKHIHSSCYS